MPASSAMLLKYSTTSSDSLMVTGFLSLEAYGFFRYFSLERSYSAFISATSVERAFTPCCLASRDDANQVALLALAMADDEQFVTGTHAQQQESLLVRRMLFVKELDGELVIEDRFRLIERDMVLSEI